MQTTEEAPEINNKKAIVRSLRFSPEAWVRITKMAKSKGIPLATFMRNAVLSAAGFPLEAARLRALADKIDMMNEPQPKAASVKAKKR